jgi:hypothetical protein
MLRAVAFHCSRKGSVKLYRTAHIAAAVKPDREFARFHQWLGALAVTKPSPRGGQFP